MIGYSTFNSRPFIKDYLFANDHVLAPGDLKDGISFEESVNNGEELVFGSCVAGKITFSVDNAEQNAPNVTAKEYRWRKAVEMETWSETSLKKVSRATAVCGNGSVYYVAGGSSYLSIWGGTSLTKITDIDPLIAPASPPEALCLIGNILYCLYGEEPYATVYFVTDNGFEMAGGIELTEFQKKQIKRLANRNTGLWLTDSGLTEWVPAGEDLKAYRYEWLDMGYFIAEKPEKVRETKIKVVAYDRLVKFDTVVDDWIKALKYPVTLKEMLVSLCGMVGVELVSGSYINESWIVDTAIDAEDITGREVLQYIAQANAGFCRMKPDGRLELTGWNFIDCSVNNSVYNSIELAEFVTDLIDKVQVKITDNDIGVIVGTGTNAMVIENNPLLYGESDSEIRPAVTNIYNYASTLSYQPFELKMVQSPMVRAGDVFSVTTRSGEQVVAYVMNRTLKGGIDTFEATGDQRRSSQVDPVNRYIQRLNGRVHELVATVDEFSSTIKDMKGNYSSITQTIDKISFDVYNAGGAVSAKISAEVEAGISSIDLSANRIKIQGTTTLSDIFSPGTTTISGDHIDTGSIKLTEVYFKGSTTSYLYTDGGDIIMYPGAGGGDIYMGNPSSTVYSEGDLEVSGRFDADGLAKVWGEFYVVDYAEFSDNVSVSGQLSADHVWANSGEFEDWCWSPDWTNGSDERIKHDITTLETGAMKAFVLSLRPVSYRMNKDTDGKLRYGFIAQEVKATLEDAGLDEDGSPVYRYHNGEYGLTYNDLIAPIVSVLQDLNSRVLELEKEK